MPVDVYRSYLSLKNHFTKENYDYHKYCGKSRASVQTFYKRRDRFWFEKISRNRNDKEVVDFFVSNFVSCTDPSKLWIGEMIREGESRYNEWKKKTQSLSYIFKNEVESILIENSIDSALSTQKGHPIFLKNYLSGNVSIETLIILDKILGFRNKFDKKLQDPVWQSVSLKMKKYSPFLSIDVEKFKSILKKIVLQD